MRADGNGSATIRVRLSAVLGAARQARVAPEDLTADHVDDYLARKTIVQNTRVCYYQHINQWFEFLVDEEIIAKNPLGRRRRRPKSVKGIPRPLTDRELEVVLETASAGILPILLLGCREGLRSCEIAEVRGDSFTDVALSVVGKGGKERHVPIHPDVAALRIRMPPRGWWFPSPRKGGAPATPDHLRDLVNGHLRNCGIREGSLHRLRHTFATQLVDHGVDVRVIQELLGHESLLTTQVYAKVRMRTMLAAVARLPQVT